MTQANFTILIDGECPLCVRESRFMARLDRGRGLLRIVDITSETFRPEIFGLTTEQVMGQIHGITPEGTCVKGMEVFRRAYAAVGWGWVVAPTAWPVLRWVFDRLYTWFARNRRWLTGAENRDCGDRCRVR